MRFFADENVDRLIVEWLRAQGHDLIWAAESYASIDDPHVFHVARVDARIFVTGDLGFGELVFRQGILPAGVISLRLRPPSQLQRLRLFQQHWTAVENHVHGAFVVISDRKVRIRPLR